jgi:preprotein translocase subunit SecG
LELLSNPWTRSAVFQFLLAILILDAFVLIVIVLLQAGKGGGLAAMGAAGAGTDSLFGSRQAATILTKATWWAGGTFLVLAFSLSLVSGRTTQPASILRGVGTTASPATPTPEPASIPSPAGPGAAPPPAEPAPPQ